jgi:hypothetical protein
MHVLGHHYVSDHYELVTETNLFKELQEQIAAPLSSQQRSPMVTTEGAEMEIPGAVIAV